MATGRASTIGRVHDRVDLAATARRAQGADHDLLVIAATRVRGWHIADLASDGGEDDRLRPRRRLAETRLHRTPAA